MKRNTAAPLRNVAELLKMMERLRNTPDHLTPLGVCHGHPGLGKTIAANYVANKYDGICVEVGASWTIKKFCQMLLVELGEGKPAKIIADMVEQVIARIADEERPMIIDEFDHVASWGERPVNIVREILDKAGAPIILVGEELLPSKLQAWPRFDSRVRSWLPFQPASVDDTTYLAKWYYPDLSIDRPLLKRLTDEAHGIARRVCHGLETISEESRVMGVSEVNAETWGDRPFWESRPAVRR